MNSIAEIFQNSKHLLDSITNFVNRYIGSALLHKCGIRKLVDDVSYLQPEEYCDNPIFRMIGTPEKSHTLEKIVSAKSLLVDKLLLCFMPASAYRMFKTGTFYRDYKRDTFYRFDKLQKANWERLQLETAKIIFLLTGNRDSTNQNQPNAFYNICA